MEELSHILSNYKEISELIADAIIKRVWPCQDDLSESQAKKAYGDRWIRYYKERGLADWHRVGGRILYSRHHLDSLRAAEREHARLIFKKIGKDPGLIK